MNRRVYKYITIFLFCIISYSTAQIKSIKTNLEFLSEIIDSVAVLTVADIDDRYGDKIFIKNMNLKEPLRNYLVQRFEQELFNNNFKIQYADSSGSDLYMFLIIDKAGVKYRKIHYSGIFKEKELQREAVLAYQLKIIHIKTQELLTIKNEELYKSGRFTASLKSEVEQNSSLLGVIKQPSQELTGWAEFLIAAGLFALIGYLLYIVRSR